MEVKLTRSKSLSSLTSEEHPGAGLHRMRSYFTEGLVEGHSDSSVEVYVIDDSECDSSGEAEDSGLGPAVLKDDVADLERKLDRLGELFQEQCDLLSAIKAEIHAPKPWELPACNFNSGAYNQDIAIAPSVKVEEISDTDACVSSWRTDERGRSLLDAIEMKHACAATLDHAINEALTEFLQSEELREQLVSRTASYVRDSVSSWLSRDLSLRYMPLLERHSRRMLRQVTNTLDEAFADLKEAATLKHDSKPARNIRRALYRHKQRLEEDTASCHTDLPNVVESVLEEELSQWRHKVLSLLELPAAAPESPPLEEYVPSSPPQPADPQVSIIDQLLESALITKSISEGDINSSFVRALSASDLALVMSACRAADPDLVFGKPCKLEPEVILSLMQQLATDMVHDTQLKCLYLESCISSVDPTSPAARTHLPAVAASVSRHLSRFLAAYPAHLAARRVTIILMAIGHFNK